MLFSSHLAAWMQVTIPTAAISVAVFEIVVAVLSMPLGLSDTEFICTATYLHLWGGLKRVFAANHLPACGGCSPY